MVGFKQVFKYVYGVLFVAIGVMHFASPEFFLQIMPPYLPWHGGFVYLSGFFEIAGGIGLMIPRTQRAAAWGLIALLIAVFPANIHLYLNYAEIMPDVPHALQLIRLPFQLVFIALAWWYTSPAGSAGHESNRGENFNSADPAQTS